MPAQGTTRSSHVQGVAAGIFLVAIVVAFVSKGRVAKSIQSSMSPHTIGFKNVAMNSGPGEGGGMSFRQVVYLCFGVKVVQRGMVIIMVSATMHSVACGFMQIIRSFPLDSLPLVVVSHMLATFASLANLLCLVCFLVLFAEGVGGDALWSSNQQRDQSLYESKIARQLANNDSGEKQKPSRSRNVAPAPPPPPPLPPLPTNGPILVPLPSIGQGGGKWAYGKFKRGKKEGGQRVSGEGAEGVDDGAVGATHQSQQSSHAKKLASAGGMEKFVSSYQMMYIAIKLVCISSAIVGVVIPSSVVIGSDASAVTFFKACAEATYAFQFVCCVVLAVFGYMLWSARDETVNPSSYGDLGKRGFMVLGGVVVLQCIAAWALTGIHVEVVLLTLQFIGLVLSAMLLAPIITKHDPLNQTLSGEEGSGKGSLTLNRAIEADGDAPGPAEARGIAHHVSLQVHRKPKKKFTLHRKPEKKFTLNRKPKKKFTLGEEHGHKKINLGKNKGDKAKKKFALGKEGEHGHKKFKLGHKKLGELPEVSGARPGQDLQSLPPLGSKPKKKKKKKKFQIKHHHTEETAHLNVPSEGEGEGEGAQGEGSRGIVLKQMEEIHMQHHMRRALTKGHVVRENTERHLQEDNSQHRSLLSKRLTARKSIKMMTPDVGGSGRWSAVKLKIKERRAQKRREAKEAEAASEMEE